MSCSSVPAGLPSGWCPAEPVYSRLAVDGRVRAHRQHSRVRFTPNDQGPAHLRQGGHDIDDRRRWLTEATHATLRERWKHGALPGGYANPPNSTVG